MTETFTRDEIVAEIRRELALRKRVYPTWISDGRLAQGVGDKQLALLEAAIVTLEGQSAPVTASPAPDGPPILAINWQPVNRGALVATADLVIPRWKIVFKSCGLFRQNGKEWPSLPSKEWVGSDGKRKYFDAVGFTDPEVNKRFKAAALTAFLALEQEQRESRSPVPAQPLTEALHEKLKRQGGQP